MDLMVRESLEAVELVNQPIEALVERFLSGQDARPSSKGLYRRTLRQYLKWTEEKGYPLSQINRPQLLEYKEYLLGSGKSPLTSGSYLTSVRRFYEWLEANKIYPNVAKGIKAPRRKQQFRKQPLTPDQCKALLSHYQNKAARDYALVNLLLRTGLRTIEAARSNVEDIAYKGAQRVLLVHGKGRDEKDNFVVLTDKAFQPLASYLETRTGATGSAPLFSSGSNNNKGERLTTRTISHIAKEGLKAIGLNDKAYTAHSLRHTTGTNILRAGGSLEMAQFTLRHANPATTQIYTRTLDEERRLRSSGEVLIDSLY